MLDTLFVISDMRKSKEMTEEVSPSYSNQTIKKGSDYLETQIQALKHGSKLASGIVEALTIVFEPKDSESDAAATELLIEVITWLYTYGHRGKKLEKFFLAITSSKKVTPKTIKTFAVHCNWQVRKIQIPEAVEAIMKSLNDDLKEFLSNTKETREDRSRFISMFNKFHGILVKYPVFGYDTHDRIRRSVFTCQIMLHEQNHCKILEAYIKRNGLDKSPQYINLESRKREEVRISLHDLEPLELAGMCDELDRIASET